MTTDGSTTLTTGPIRPTTTWGRVFASSMVAGTLALAAACGSSSPSATATTTPSVVQSTSSPATSSPVITAAGPPTLSVATNAKIGQQIVVDSSGKTVYLYVPDGTGTASTVSAALKAKWPPVAVSGTPTAATGLDSSKLAAQVQSDGTEQVSYGGHLLYTFSGDAAAGDANGEGLGTVWYAVSLTGNQVG